MTPIKLTRYLATVVLIMGAAAAEAGRTRVVQTGPDTYMVASNSVKGWSSSSAQKVKAIERATEHCEKLGRRMEIVSSNVQSGGFARQASADVEFRCVIPTR